MSQTKIQNSTNTTKRSFLKTLALSFAFISFGGIGAILKSIFFDEQDTVSKTGFGSNGYGK